MPYKLIKNKLQQREFAFTGVAFLALGIFVLLYSELPRLAAFDEQLIQALVPLRKPGWNSFFTELTALGSFTVLTLLSVSILLFLVSLRLWRPFNQLLIASLGSALITQLLKTLVLRERPPLELRLDLVHGFSFPSGHSCSSVAIYLTLALIALPAQRPSTWRIIFSIYALVLAIMIAFSRVYLAVHYPSDAAAGFFLGLGIACLSAALASAWKANR